MQLYTTPASPYCRKVDIVLRETGQRDLVEDIPAAGHPTDTGTMPVSVNPMGKIPVLAREDAPALYDSRVICQFLNARVAGSLYPEARLWDALTLEATGDGICDAAILMIYEARSRPENLRSSDWVEGQWNKIARALDVLEDRWISMLNGPLTIGHIAVGCALGYLDLRLADRNWRDGHPELTKWYAGFADLPSMIATNPAA